MYAPLTESKRSGRIWTLNQFDSRLTYPVGNRAKVWPFYDHLDGERHPSFTREMSSIQENRRCQIERRRLGCEVVARDIYHFLRRHLGHCSCGVRGVGQKFGGLAVEF